MKLSAVIITFNEERNLQRCLDSLKGVADEIIVVDSFSTDATQRIAEAAGAIFIQHAFEGHIQQKNYALTCAQHEWILSLDADEALSPRLKHRFGIIESLVRISAKRSREEFHQVVAKRCVK